MSVLNMVFFMTLIISGRKSNLPSDGINNSGCISICIKYADFMNVCLIQVEFSSYILQEIHNQSNSFDISSYEQSI